MNSDHTLYGVKVDRAEQDELRRERIARTAFELFAQVGLDQTSAQDIAQAAFVSRTNLYRYFPSKTHMLLAHFERTVHDTRDEALSRLKAGSAPHLVWQQVTSRMADLGVRYRHLVGAVGRAVLGGQPLRHRAEMPPASTEPHTAWTLVDLIEPVLQAMYRQGHIRPDADIRLLATLFVDACLLALLQGSHRNQHEVLHDWQDRFSLIMQGALTPEAATRPEWLAFQKQE